MPYIGVDINYGNIAKMTGTGDGSDTTPIAALTYTVPSNESILVFLDGVAQVPGTDFTATGTTLTFTTAPASGVAILVMFLGRSLDIGTPGDGTVSLAKMAVNSIDSDQYVDASIDNAHLADDAVGVAELSATGTASSSTFLRGDNAWAAAGGVVATAGAYAYRAANQSIATATTTKVAWDTELYDIGGDFDSTTNNRYTVASGEAGKYFVTSCLNINVATDATSVQLFLYKNGQQLVRAKNTSGDSNSVATVALTTVVELAAADYLEVYAHHTKGSNADITGNVNRNWFIIMRFD